MNKIYFGGCSITEGDGFVGKKDNCQIYPNLLSSDIINDSEGGSSNLKIFTKGSTAIIDNLASVILYNGAHCIDIGYILHQILASI